MRSNCVCTGRRLVISNLSFFSSHRKYFLLPLALWVICLTIFPLLFSLVLSFTHYQLGGEASFAGFANYSRLLGDYRFWNALRVTASLATAATFLELVLGLALAILLFETTGGFAARRAGVTGNIWRVPLTLPQLRPTLALIGLLRFVEALKTVDLPFSLTGGGPAIATETLSLYAYRKCMKFFDFGYGSALAYVLFALVLVVSQLLARWNLKTLTYKDAVTMPVIIAGTEHTQGVQFWYVATRSLLALIPPVMLAVFAQRFLIRGLTLGAVKG